MMFRMQYKAAWVEVSNDLMAEPIIQPSEAVLNEAGLTEAEFNALAYVQEKTGDHTLSNIDNDKVLSAAKDKKGSDLIKLYEQQQSTYQETGILVDPEEIDEALGWMAQLKAMVDLDRTLAYQLSTLYDDGDEYDVGFNDDGY